MTYYLLNEKERVQLEGMIALELKHLQELVKQVERNNIRDRIKHRALLEKEKLLKEMHSKISKKVKVIVDL